MNFSNCTAEELWKFVAKHLATNNLHTVLVGGTVVTIYSKGAYSSGDLDLILTNIFNQELEPAMNAIGFKKTGRHYTHPQCKHFFIEFPKGPLGIGDDINIKPISHSEDGVKFSILSPTDCIKDRLASN